MEVTWPGSIALFRGAELFIQAVIKNETFYTYARVGGGKKESEKYSLTMRSTDDDDLRYPLDVFPCKVDIILGRDVQGIPLDDERLEIVNAAKSWRYRSVRINYDLTLKSLK